MKKIIFFITAMCLFAMHGCQKDIEAPINDIAIADKVSAAAKTATISGTVECPVSITKIELWIDSDENFSNHTVHDIKLSDKAFSILVKGLNFNTTYYYKYVVYTAVDMAELEKKNFITQDGTLPLVTTANLISITANTAVCGGNVTSDGNLTVTARGVCWSTSPNPTISNNRTIDGTGRGSFTSNITGLSSSTTYYVRAYATNSKGTAYGNQISFTTQSSGTNPSITVNFGGNSWEAAGTSGFYYASPGVVAINAYSDAIGQKFPMFTSGLMIATSGTYTDAVTEELGYADGIISWLEYWEATYWTIDGAQYGDWWAKNATINVTELDLTAMSVSMNINATMFEFADVVVINGTNGTIDMSLLPGATTRSLSVNVTQVSLQSAKQSFNKKTISIVK